MSFSLPPMEKRLLLFACLLAAGCAGSAEAPATPATGGTAGGETTRPAEMRATTPIPVPQPGRAREQLSPELQAVWERVEMAIALAPPEPPSGSTQEDIEAWAEGPFRQWVERRLAATNHALEPMRAMREAPVEERAMGAALFGYLYEDAVSSIRGAPIPDAVAGDPELLAIYSETLNSALLPYARMAAQAYYGCVVLFREVEDEAWAEWPAYCDTRGSEVVDVFELVPEEPPPGPQEPPDAPAPEGPEGETQSGEGGL